MYDCCWEKNMLLVQVLLCFCQSTKNMLFVWIMDTWEMFPSYLWACHAHVLKWTTFVFSLTCVCSHCILIYMWITFMFSFVLVCLQCACAVYLCIIILVFHLYLCGCNMHLRCILLSTAALIPGRFVFCRPGYLCYLAAMSTLDAVLEEKRGRWQRRSQPNRVTKPDSLQILTSPLTRWWSALGTLWDTRLPKTYGLWFHHLQAFLHPMDGIAFHMVSGFSKRPPCSMSFWACCEFKDPVKEALQSFVVNAPAARPPAEDMGWPYCVWCMWQTRFHHSSFDVHASTAQGQFNSEDTGL